MNQSMIVGLVADGVAVAGAAAGGYAGTRVQRHLQDNKTTRSVENGQRVLTESTDRQ